MEFSGFRKTLAWLFAVGVCLFITKMYHFGDRMDDVIWSDQEGYYVYLPAIFIHGGFEHVECISGCDIVETANGTRAFTKYTYGVALLESPFFLVANAMAHVLGYPRDGRSMPYVWAVMIAAIFYMLAGLRLLAKLLSELGFSRLVSWLVSLGMLFGTNLFHYTFRESGMSHVYSFFLFSALIYGSHRKLNSEHLKWRLMTAVSLALIILIRPTNVIAILIPMLWGIDTKNFKNHLKKWFSDFRWFLLFGLTLAILFLPQMLYWKHMTGSYIFYSYGSEGFVFWNRPKMLKVLFSPQNGWLIYSPIALLGLLGIGMMIKRHQKGWLLPIVTLSLATYIFGSWWAWWFGGAFGHRCYVDFLPILALPSAFAVAEIGKSNRIVALGFAIMAILALYVNLRMSYVYEGMWDGPNWGWYDYIGKLKQAFFR
ncbi:MAG: hypothetical protein K9J17_06015 [Flavobacteriales bacterium]|nr:hypothetical protein [Flavobacteriales bacterium]